MSESSIEIFGIMLILPNVFVSLYLVVVVVVVLKGSLKLLKISFGIIDLLFLN